MGRRGKSIPMSAILIGTVFIFLMLVIMMIPVLPFEVSPEEQTILYLTVFLIISGMLVILMRNAKVI